jgi:hypothetical protein
VNDSLRRMRPHRGNSIRPIPDNISEPLKPGEYWLRKPDPSDPSDEGEIAIGKSPTLYGRLVPGEWEYKVVGVSQEKGSTAKICQRLEAALNEYGDEAWELVSLAQVYEPHEHARAVFKRRKVE